MERIKKRIVFEVSKKKHSEIKIAAATLGMTMKDFIDIAIRDYVKKSKKRKKNEIF